MRAPWLSLPADADLWTREDQLPPPCAAGDVDGVPGIQSEDVLRERDCLATTEPQLRLQLNGWIEWFREQGAKHDGQAEFGGD